MSPALVNLLLEERDRMSAGDMLGLLPVVAAGVAPSMAKEGGKAYKQLWEALLKGCSTK